GEERPRVEHVEEARQREVPAHDLGRLRRLGLRAGLGAERRDGDRQRLEVWRAHLDGCALREGDARQEGEGEGEGSVRGHADSVMNGSAAQRRDGGAAWAIQGRYSTWRPSLRKRWRNCGGGGGSRAARTARSSAASNAPLPLRL